MDQQYTVMAASTPATLPVEALGPRIAIYTKEFADHPHRAYRMMRERYNSAFVPVEIAPGLPATLVIDHPTAVRILNDPDRFTADPREWEQTLQPHQWGPIMPMIQYRPNAVRSNGAEHARYRQATTNALAGIDQYALSALVERTAVDHINNFCRRGSADLISEYCLPLVFEVVTTIVGCTDEIGQRLVAATAALFDGQDTDTVNDKFDDALRALTQFKRHAPGDDITTRLLHHAAGLTDDEMVQQLLTIFSAGIEVPQNYIANTLLLMLTEPERFIVSGHGLPPTTASALDEILIVNPPMGNHCLTYPRQPTLINGVWLPAHQPVIISMAACNASPEVNTGQYTGNRSHLAWGTGPHACPMPARIMAQLIAEGAIDQLFDVLPDLRLAQPAETLQWRPAPFHRALSALPVLFSATAPQPLPKAQR